jgi:hypothetical protein
MIQSLKIIGTGLATIGLVGAAVYENPDIQKKQIYLENKGKSGIYR